MVSVESPDDLPCAAPTPAEGQVSGADDPIELGELYHENSKLHQGDRSFGSWVTVINQTQALQAPLVASWRAVRGVEVVPLGSQTPSDPPQTRALDAVLEQRRSVRAYRGPISLDALSGLLRWTYGHIRPARHPGSLESRRSCPSPGALYTLDLYVQVQAVDGLEPGVYQYRVHDHALGRMGPPTDPSALAAAIYNPEMAATASVIVWFVGVFGRGRYKYKKRAYRFVLLETGHAAQTLLLRTASLGLGACAIGGFADDEVAEMLGVDGVDEAPIYGVALGPPATR